MSEIIIAVLVMLFLSVLISFSLSFLSKRFKTNSSRDEEIKSIKDILPNIDCGACGFISCEGFARAIIDKKIDSSKKCRVLKKDKREELEKKIKK